MVKELAYLSKWQNALAYLSKWQNALAYPSQMAVFQFVCSSLFRGLKSDRRIQRDLFVKFCIVSLHVSNTSNFKSLANTLCSHTIQSQKIKAFLL